MRSQEDHICSDKQVDNINKYTTKLQGQYMLVVADPPTVNLPDNRNDRQKGSWILQQFGFWSVYSTDRLNPSKNRVWNRVPAPMIKILI
jgi:hypothetical protein